METIPAKHLVLKTKTTDWFGADYNMNIYQGCCHGCIYCDSRSNCYGIQDFPRVRAKENALAILREDLRGKTRTGVISTGSMSDPYNPFEEKLRLTGQALELIHRHGFGVGIATKSPLVARDEAVLSAISAHSPVIVKMTVTTADEDLCKKIEPGVAGSKARWKAIKKLSTQGIFCGILMMPILPFINDMPENISQIVLRSAEAGAKFIYAAMGMTLREGQREYFYEQLTKNFPGTKEQYEGRYGNQYQAHSPQAAELYALFESLCKENGLLYRMKDIVAAYKLPYYPEQLNLF